MLELNKIHLGDCYELIKQIPDKSVDLIITDPPYLIENTNAGGNSNLSRSIQNMNNELASEELTQGIDYDLLKDFIRVCKTPNIYIWCNHKQIPQYLDFFVRENECAFDILIWNKVNAMPLFNNKYLTDKEYCLYFRKGGYCNPKDYESAKTVFYEPINIYDKKMFEHPTIKPLKFIRTMIENSSKVNDLILDPFMGSGTTAVAARETGRQFIGFEINPKWHKIACDRLNCITAGGQQSLFLM
jgi:site-specific DNA-methyltransferase (adenine-specific)